jgi:hypothetical protein
MRTGSNKLVTLRTWELGVPLRPTKSEHTRTRFFFKSIDRNTTVHASQEPHSQCRGWIGSLTRVGSASKEGGPLLTYRHRSVWLNYRVPVLGENTISFVTELVFARVARVRGVALRVGPRPTRVPPRQMGPEVCSLTSSFPGSSCCPSFLTRSWKRKGRPRNPSRWVAIFPRGGRLAHCRMAR